MNRQRLWVGIAASAVFSAFMMFLVVRDMDWIAAFAALRDLKPGSVFLAMLLIGVTLVARSLRWHYLLCERLPLKRSVNLTFVAFWINNLLPFRVGDLGRIEAAARGRHSVSRVTTLSVAVMERLIDLLTLVLLFGVSVSQLPSTPAEIQNTVLVMTVFSVSAVVAAVALATLFEQRAKRLVAAVEQRIPLLARLRISEKFDSLLMGLAFVRTPRYAVLAVFWNLIAWGLLIVAYQIVLTSLFPDAELAEAILCVVAIAFAITVPTTIASLGIIEAGAVLALTSQGYPYDESFAIGITLHLITLVIYTIQGIYGMWSETLQFSTFLDDVMQTPVKDSI